MRPLYKGHFGVLILVLNTEVSSIQRSLNTLQYYIGTRNGVLIIEVSTFQRFVIERSHCVVQYMLEQVTLDSDDLFFYFSLYSLNYPYNGVWVQWYLYCTLRTMYVFSMYR